MSAGPPVDGPPGEPTEQDDPTGLQEHDEAAPETAVEAAQRASDAARRAEDAAAHAEDAAAELDHAEASAFGEPGNPFAPHSPFYTGLVGGMGVLTALLLGLALASIQSVLVLIVVSLFLAAGLNPIVGWLERRGMRRGFAVLVVILAVLAALALFVVAIIPVIADQVAAITANAPGWLDQLQGNRRMQQLDSEYDILSNLQDYVARGDFVSGLFGGVLGIGLKILSALLNAFVIVVLTLYFLSSLDKTKHALYSLAPASRRERVAKIGDRVVADIGSYVSGAFVVALAAGLSSLVFLFAVGLGEYAVALAFVVALLDFIPMIGATIGAVVVTAIGFATDVNTGVACLVFFVVYQQVENYVIYPRVMSRSVDLPGSVIVIAALIGAALLGVVGALLAIPTASALLLVVREVFQRRQDAR